MLLSLPPIFLSVCLSLTLYPTVYLRLSPPLSVCISLSLSLFLSISLHQDDLMGIEVCYLSQLEILQILAFCVLSNPGWN